MLDNCLGSKYKIANVNQYLCTFVSAVAQQQYAVALQKAQYSRSTQHKSLAKYLGIENLVWALVNLTHLFNYKYLYCQFNHTYLSDGFKIALLW